ncbi:MAG: hypothetical protein M8364_05405 [Methylobacter sp.]|uniref:hypothetical protein n=1 Tax=Methylobacter sp. TaxID=2051955 RepID=UPI002587D88E|nr:hypothetical protein [Methylobacter sp.]MCL7420321.1 hypothetical protein [Methylobacter sp.]
MMAMYWSIRHLYYKPESTCPTKKSNNPSAVPGKPSPCPTSVFIKIRNPSFPLSANLVSNLDSENKKALTYPNAIPVYAGWIWRTNPDFSLNAPHKA